jgi:hypothetical protein
MGVAWDAVRERAFSESLPGKNQGVRAQRVRYQNGWGFFLKGEGGKFSFEGRTLSICKAVSVLLVNK